MQEIDREADEMLGRHGWPPARVYRQHIEALLIEREAALHREAALREETVRLRGQVEYWLAQAHAAQAERDTASDSKEAALKETAALQAERDALREAEHDARS